MILGKIHPGTAPETLESEDLLSATLPPQYDVSAAGQSFLTTVPAEDENAPPPTTRVVENWHEDFRDREQD